MPIYSLTGFFVCIDFFRVNYYEKEGIKNNLSTSLWRRFPLFKCVFKLGLFGRMQGAFLFVGRGLAPAVVLFGQPKTKVPTVIKQAFIFSHTKRALRARRAPQTVRWTVCSQSGEQFIIATGGFSPGHSRGSSRQRLFCFFFLRLKKEDIPHPLSTIF